MSSLPLQASVPAGWRVRSLGEVAEVAFSNVDKKTVPGEVPVRLCNYLDVYQNDSVDDALPYMEATATMAEIGKFGLRPGDVIITKDSETPDDIGIPTVVKLIGQDLVCGYHLALIRPSASLDSSFLAKQLATARARQYFYREANGTTRYGLSNRAVVDLPLLLCSLQEQRRIAEILDTLDDLIRRTEEVIAKLKQVKQGLLHHLLTRGIDENGELRDPERHPEQFTSSDLGRIPCEWERGVLDHWISESPKNGYSPSEIDEWSGTLMLGLGCLTPDGFEPRQLKNAPRNDPRLSGALLRDGDLLISRSNTRDLVGLVGRYADVGHSCIYPDLMMRLRPSSRVLPEFLELVLSSAPVRKQLVAAACGTSGSMVKISGAIVRNLLVAIPRIPEQLQILRHTGAVSRKIRDERKERGKLAQLKAGLTKDLLTGRVRLTAHGEIA